MAPQAGFLGIFPFKVTPLLPLHHVAPGEARVATEAVLWYLGMLAGKDLEVAAGPHVCAGASRQLSPSQSCLPRKV